MASSDNQFTNYMNQALNTLKQGYTQGTGALTKYYNEAQGYGADYRKAGGQALQDYMGSMGMLGGGAQQSAYNKFTATPGYQFALNQATRASQRQMAAGGMSGSGAETLALQQNAQGMANQEYGQYQNRLAQMAQGGLQASESAANRAVGMGTSLADLGYKYAAGGAEAYGALGKGLEDERLAKEQINAQKKSSFWGSLGKFAGTIGGAVIGKL